MVRHVVKRDDNIALYDSRKIENAVYKAAIDKKEGNPRRVANDITINVGNKISKMDIEVISVEEIQDLIEETLIEKQYKKIAKEFILYRQKRNEERGEPWLSEDYSISLWERKYQFEDESMQETINRVAKNSKRIRKRIRQKYFSPAGRILANRDLYNHGLKVTYSNCYVTAPPEDNLESIFNTDYNFARTFSYGGGMGGDISRLSPRGARIRNAAKSTTGSLSFAEYKFNETAKVIGQKGRRAAMMISLADWHPDLEDFIDLKNDPDVATKMNISIRTSDDFMQAVMNNKIWKMSFTREETGETIEKEKDANYLFNKIAYSNWYMSEPGFLYWDRIEDWNLLSNDKEFKYAGVNPCGDFSPHVKHWEKSVETKAA